MRGVLQDVVVCSRKLRRRPVWALTVVAVLALGISANTAMFAAFDAWVTRPLPFPKPEQLVTLTESQLQQGTQKTPASARNLLDWEERQSSFQQLAAFRQASFNLADEGDPARVIGARVSHSLFDTLGVHPVLGRGFLPEDDQPGQQPTVALVSHRLWQERYAGDPAVIGTTIQLDGFPFEIIGVMPDGFRFPNWQEVWTPLGIEPRARARDERGLSVVGRLAPGRTIDQARADLRQIASEIERESPETNSGWSVEVEPLRDFWVPSVINVALTVCLFTGVFVMLIVCANVASLMLAETSARAREMAVRAALGASGWRLARQILVENVLLALAAGVTGAFLSVFLVDWMTSRAPIDPPYPFRTILDGRVLFYALVASILAGAAVAVAPILRRSTRDLFEALKSGGRATSTVDTARLRRALVVSELALSTALAIGALLLVKSFWYQQNVDPGYRTAELYSMELSLSGHDFETEASRIAFLGRLNQELLGSSVISALGLSDALPSRGGSVTRVETPARPAELQEGERVLRYAISSRYLETLDIAMISGRRFTDSELREGGDVTIISASLARALWGRQDVVGLSLRPVSNAPDAPWLRVVGVVENVNNPEDMVSSDRPVHQAYRPYPSVPGASINLVVQSRHPPAVVAAAVRDGVRRTGLPVPVSEILTMEQTIRRSQWVTRLFSELLAVYAVLALLIAAVGLYGLVSDSVSQRTNEMAIRLALGAGPRDINRAIVGSAARLGAVGLSAGVMLGIAAAHFAGSMLTGVKPTDPVVLSAVAVVLAATLLAASYGPARRAANTDPARSLRAE